MKKLALVLSIVMSTTLPVEAKSKFVFGRLKCAENVNNYLNTLGRKVTNSRSSHSFHQKFKRTSSPKKGDVLFVDRPGDGGHVAVYVGNGQCDNPSENRGWKRVNCSSIWRGKKRFFVSTR
jgi:hypothetical protein